METSPHGSRLQHQFPKKLTSKRRPPLRVASYFPSLPEDPMDPLDRHYTMFRTAHTLAETFTAAFLLSSGQSIRSVLSFFCIAAVVRLLLRPQLIRWARRSRTNLLPILRTGALGFGVYLSILALTSTLPRSPLVALAILYGGADILYWIGFHLLYAFHTEAHDVGGKLGLREAGLTLLGVLIPVSAATLIQTAGAASLFLLGASLCIFCLIPLRRLLPVRIPEPSPHKTRPLHIPLQLGLYDGLLGFSNMIVWEMTVFGIFEQSFTRFGTFLSGAALCGAGVTFWIGCRIDRKPSLTPVLLSASFGIITACVLKAFAFHPGTALLAELTATAAMAIYRPVFLSIYYASHRSAPDPMENLLVSEQGYDLSILLVAVFATTSLALFGDTRPALLIAAVAALLNHFFLQQQSSPSEPRVQRAHLPFPENPSFLKPAQRN